MLKKSQAAMEFIITYGWAIIVVLVTISALAYFGVLDVDRFFPDKCMIDAGISCLDHKMIFVDADAFIPARNNLDLIIKNNLGWKIEDIEIYFPEFDKNEERHINLLNSEKSEKGEIIVSDVTDAINLGTNPKSKEAFKKGEKYDLDFIISFTHTQSGLIHKYNGNIKGKIN